MRAGREPFADFFVAVLRFAFVAMFCSPFVRARFRFYEHSVILRITP
jgi:hypothetical protein